MIKIFYDHQKFSTQQYGGISRYFANLIQALRALPDFDYQLGVLFSNNHYIENKFSLGSAIASLLKNPDYAYRLNKIYCEYLLGKNNFDIFHPTYYDTYFLDKLKKPLVITVHDMTHERFPGYFWSKDPLIRLKRKNIEKADRIIAISETTKYDLLKYSNVDEKKIKVIYHGMDLEAPFLATPVQNIPESYFLFVGDRSGYKNFYLLLNAFKKISTQYPEVRLILTGGGSLDVAETEYIDISKLKEKISHTNASDSELNFLYKHALAFIYPSLHEGFGLPILEAFKADCPIVVSDTKCFHEIARDAALYFDPYSADDLSTKLEKILSDKMLRQGLIHLGKTRLMDFPLHQSLSQTVEVYKELI